MGGQEPHEVYIGESHPFRALFTFVALLVLTVLAGLTAAFLVSMVTGGLNLLPWLVAIVVWLGGLGLSIVRAADVW